MCAAACALRSRETGTMRATVTPVPCIRPAGSPELRVLLEHRACTNCTPSRLTARVFLAPQLGKTPPTPPRAMMGGERGLWCEDLLHGGWLAVAASGDAKPTFPRSSPIRSSHYSGVTPLAQSAPSLCARYYHARNGNAAVTVDVHSQEHSQRCALISLYRNHA